MSYGARKTSNSRSLLIVNASILLFVEAEFFLVQIFTVDKGKVLVKISQWQR